MTAKLEKGGGTFEGIKLLLCENPLPPLDEARLGSGYMRITIALPEDNARFVATLKAMI